MTMHLFVHEIYDTMHITVTNITEQNMLDKFHATQKSTKITIVIGMIIVAGIIASITCFYTSTGMRDVIEQDVFIGSVVAAGVLLAIITAVGLLLEYGFETKRINIEYTVEFDLEISEDGKTKTLNIRNPVGIKDGLLVKPIQLVKSDGKEADCNQVAITIKSEAIKDCLSDNIQKVLQKNRCSIKVDKTRSSTPSKADDPQCDCHVIHNGKRLTSSGSLTITAHGVESRELKPGLRCF